MRLLPQEAPPKSPPPGGSTLRRLLPMRLLPHHAPPPTRLTLTLFEFLLLLYFQRLTRHSSGPTFSSPWSPTCCRRSSHSPHLIDGLSGLVNHWQVSHTGHLIPLPWLVPRSPRLHPSHLCTGL